MMAAPWQQQKLVLVPLLQGGADSLEGLPFILILTVGMCMQGKLNTEVRRNRCRHSLNQATR
jgi:hypothetical protein